MSSSISEDTTALTPGLPGIDQFYDMAELARASLPQAFAAAARDVILQIVDWPPAALLQEMEISNPLELTGLYDGIPLTEKSFVDQAFAPDVIWLFREPILDEWQQRADVSLERLIGHVYIHELAHHFGWSDADIAAIDPWWE